MNDAESAPLAPEGLEEELRGRHALATARLKDAGAACLVAIRDQSITWLTGYTTMTWKMYSRPVVAVLAADGRLMVLAAETEVDSVRLRVPGADVRTYVEMHPVTEDPRLPDGEIQFAPHAAQVLGEMIEEAGPGDVLVDGLGAVWPPIGQLTRLIPGVAGRERCASAMLWDLRMRKSVWELDRMRRAAQVLDRAYEIVCDQIAPGMSERRIDQLFSMAQLEAGAHEVGPHGVVAGPDRGLFGFPTEKVWRRDDLLYLDGAPIVDGYWSDYCRTFAARPVRPDEREGYARARAGLETAVAGYVPGQTAGEMGAAMAKAMDIAPHEVGFGRFGHGIGLHVPEPPSLHVADRTPLKTSFTFCIEPAVVHEGVNYVLEEVHVVTDDGLERLSPRAPQEIIVL